MGKSDDRGSKGSRGGYAALLGIPHLRLWVVLLLCQRFTVALAPAGLVYLGMAGEGSLARGSVLVGAHAIAEALCAASLGRRFDRRPIRHEFALVFLLQALFLTVAGLFVRQLPFVALVALVAVGGGIAAGAHGGLRALAIRLAPNHVRPVIGLESALSTVVWMVAPVAAAGLAVVLGPVAPTLAIAAFAVLGAATAQFMAQPSSEATHVATPVPWRLLVPSCAQSGAAMLAAGGLTVALFGLLPLWEVSTDSAGIWLSVMAGAGFFGAIGYGARSWRGRPVVQTSVLLGGFCVVIAGVALMGMPAPAFVLVMLAGLLQPAVGATRSLAVQEMFPQQSLSAAFSTVYASAGVGYGAAGLIAGAVLTAAGPRQAVLACAGIALLITVASAAMELRHLPAAKRAGHTDNGAEEGLAEKEKAPPSQG